MASSTPLLDSLRLANLLPSKVIPDSFQPTVHLDVRFYNSSNNNVKSISNGTLMRVSEVKEAPLISISSPATETTTGETPKSLTLMMIDPDAPTPDDPKFAYWRHWVVTGIPYTADGSVEVKGADAGAGRTLTPYLAPGPKDESGPHRYLFLLFAEPEGLKLEAGDVGGVEFVERRSFRAEEFVERHGLRLVGVQWMRGVGDGWKGAE
ncbi:PEBP-like protein [Canariomyces notabilis]|uniref:PEBP-like protein n=1 Tax=Canariomyces notabilis TaxID=2074819 RepID=A0AAN6THS2_9PEZI|nr:PEBP-like protein [Canariomyces arenarius]